jgi:PEGA domain-containing protein
MKPAPVSNVKGPEDGATLKLPSRQEETVVAEGRTHASRQESPAMSQPLIRDSHEHEPREREPESSLVRPEPIVGVELFAAEATPPLRAKSMDEAPFGMPVQSGSRAFLVTSAVVVSFAAGFGGGFVVGQFSRPATESINVSHPESVAAPQQPTRAAEEVPKPIASTKQTAAPISEEKVLSPKPIAASEPIAAPVAPQRAVPAVEAGRLVVRSTPAGADVMVDGQSRGVTPLTLRELAFGAHTIAVSHQGHDTRRQRVTLSERRPARSVSVTLRPTNVPAPTTAATNTTGSLQVASRPSGAQVFVDDNLIGTTPFLLPNVAAGSRHLRFELSGYQSWTTSVQIEPSARSRVSASLEP